MLKRQFEEDTAALWDLLVRHDPLPPSHVRIVAAATLRKWLLDGHISKLANELGVTFTLPCLDAHDIAAAIAARTDVNFFLAGGVTMDGVPIRGYYVSDAEYTGEPLIPIAEMEWKHVPPSKFLKVQRVYHLGHWFDTEQILRFIANKHGGVHIDARREQPWQHHLERASAFFTLGNPHDLEHVQLIENRAPAHQIHLVLPKEVGHIWTCLDVELLAMAQSLVNVRCDGTPLLEFGS